MVMSGMYLTQCTPLQTLSTPSNSPYPQTRSHGDVEDRFYQGGMNRPNNLTSSDSSSNPTRLLPDDGKDVYFNEEVTDKYRWLEEMDLISPDYAKEQESDRERNLIGTRAESDIPKGQLDNRTAQGLQKINPNEPTSEVTRWVDAQNATTQDYLSRVPYADKIRQNVDSLYNNHHLIRESKHDFGKITLFRGADTVTRLTFTDLEGNVKELWHDSDDRVLAVDDVYISPKGHYVAIPVSTGYADSDRVSLHIVDSRTGEPVTSPKFVGGQINRQAHSFIWQDDDSLVYPNSDTFTIMRHDVGTKRLTDPILFNQNDGMIFMKGFSLTGKNNRYLLVRNFGTLDSDRTLMKDLHTGKVYRLHHKKHDTASASKMHDYFVYSSFIHLDEQTGDVYLVSGENDELRGEIIKTNLNNLAKREVVVPASHDYDIMLSAVYHDEGAGYFVIHYRKDGQSKVVLTDMSGKPIKDLTPDVGQVTDIASVVIKPEDKKPNDNTENHISFRFSNPALPRTVYKYSVTKDAFIDVRRRDLFPFDDKAYKTELVLYPAKDGTQIPMTITYKKGTVLNGKNPVLLQGYGGFSVSVNTSFSNTYAVWLEHGGIFAQAHLRGGSEYGENWHAQGKKANRHTVFDDFDAAADYLIGKGYTSPEYLAITGGSNGGLLVGAAMTRSPNKYRVATPMIGVLDMLRADQFSYLASWQYEYGSAYNNPDMYQYLKSYSPYHNVHAGVCYPSTLVMTSKRDDRVLPAHSYKFAAVLQEKQSCNNPTLLFADENQGHGPRSPNAFKEAAVLATAFRLYEMGIGDVPIVVRPSLDELKGEKWLAEEAEEKANAGN